MRTRYEDVAVTESADEIIERWKDYHIKMIVPPVRRHKINMNHPTLRHEPSPYRALLRRAVKNGGGSVMEFRRDNANGVYVAGDRTDALLGLIRVSADALTAIPSGERP